MTVKSLTLICGLSAAVIWSFSGILTKVATGQKYCNLNPTYAGFFMGIGGLLIFTLNLFWEMHHQPNGLANLNWPGVVTSISTGFLWGLGSIIVIKGLNWGIDIGRAATIYNANTLGVIFLGIVLLKEACTPKDMARLFLSGLLMVIAVLLALPPK